MMNAVSHALVELLRREVLGDAVPVNLDAPNRPWSQATVRPTVNMFLYDVRENMLRREVMLEPVRDSNGAVVGRRSPATRYDLHYVLSVWGCPVELEYQLLSALVVGLGSHAVLPPEFFEEPDPDAPATFLTTAAGTKRAMLPMFSGELKMQIELTVATPTPVSAVTFVVGPPVREPARITVLGQSPDDIAAKREAIARMPEPRTEQGDPHAATRTAIAAAVAALPPPPPAKPPAPAGSPPGARPPGAAPGGGRPPGAPPGAAAPGGARPPGAAGPPTAAPPPLVQLRAALAQAAQAQAVLAQAVASLSTMLPSGAPAQRPPQPPVQASAGPSAPGPAGPPAGPPQPPPAGPAPSPAAPAPEATA
jgi:Pvc16 N-terminal domain